MQSINLIIVIFNMNLNPNFEDIDLYLNFEKYERCGQSVYICNKRTLHIKDNLTNYTITQLCPQNSFQAEY